MYSPQDLRPLALTSLHGRRQTQNDNPDHLISNLPALICAQLAYPHDGAGKTYLDSQSQIPFTALVVLPDVRAPRYRRTRSRRRRKSRKFPSNLFQLKASASCEPPRRSGSDTCWWPRRRRHVPCAEIVAARFAARLHFPHRLRSLQGL